MHSSGSDHAYAYVCSSAPHVTIVNWFPGLMVVPALHLYVALAPAKVELYSTDSYISASRDGTLQFAERNHT